MKPCNYCKLCNSGALHHGAESRIWGTQDLGGSYVTPASHRAGVPGPSPPIADEHTTLRIKQVCRVLKRHTQEEDALCDILENPPIHTFALSAGWFYLSVCHNLEPRARELW